MRKSKGTSGKIPERFFLKNHNAFFFLFIGYNMFALIKLSGWKPADFLLEKI